MSKRKPPARPTRQPSTPPLFDLPGLDRLIPPSLAHWRPLLTEGLAFFLAQLPPNRQIELVNEQLALASSANGDTARRLVALLTQCPTLHKLGQVIARHPRLDPDLRRQLQQLESLPSTTDPTRLATRIAEELLRYHGPGSLNEIEIGQTPLAEGSVAVVTPFQFTRQGKRQEGVFKLLKPGIREQLDTELGILVTLAPWLETRSLELGLPPVDYVDLLQTVHRLMMSEVRLDLEQHHLSLAARQHERLQQVTIPRLLPWCTPNMTAMTRIHGQKITDAILSPGQRQHLANTLISALLGHVFWNRDEYAMVHADLHAGNLFVTDDGQLAVLDWSLTATLTRAHRQALVSIVLGGILLDAARIRQAVAELSSLEADDTRLGHHVEAALDRIVLQGQTPGFDWLLKLFDDLALHASASFWDDFVLLRKSWQSLSGVIHDLAGKNTSPDPQLTRLALQSFLAELPDRTMAAPDSADFSTHVSNLDLLTLAISPALISLRWWNRWAGKGH